MSMEMKDAVVSLMEATYGQVKDIKYDIALLPWGATEPHGQHLPYGTDCILSQAIAMEAAKKAYVDKGIRAMVLPPVFLGSQNPGQRQLPFCLHGRYETQRAILADIVDSLQHQGLSRLAIINGHGGNNFKNMLRDLAIDHPDFLIVAGEWFGGMKLSDYFEEHCDHADEMETSVMLYYYPELVRMDMVGTGESVTFASEALRRGVAWMPRDWSKVSRDTGIGNPRRATAEKGKAFADKCVSNWASLIADLMELLYQNFEK